MATPRGLSGARLRAAVAVNKELGVASIEFVWVFFALFLVFYAIAAYSLMFGAWHSMSLAVAEGGRAALRYQQAANRPQALGLREGAARLAAEQHLSWVQRVSSGNLKIEISSSEACLNSSASVCEVTVRARYSDYRSNPVIPSLPGFAQLLPPELSSVSVVHISPIQLL